MRKPDGVLRLFFDDVEKSLDEKAPMQVGLVETFIGKLPDTHLPLDGAEISIAVAPNLAFLLGDQYGTPSDNLHFVMPTVPDSPGLFSGVRKL